VLRGHAPGRAVLSEYHAAGSVTGAFMIRKGPFKYVHYVGMRPQLFDLASDPLEQRDLGTDPGWHGVVAGYERLLRGIVNPEAANDAARRDQAARIEQEGGREAILKRGTFGFSPAPGTQPVYD
jgi:choline-sulfatase